MARRLSLIFTGVAIAAGAVATFAAALSLVRLAVITVIIAVICAVISIFADRFVSDTSTKELATRYSCLVLAYSILRAIPLYLVLNQPVDPNTTGPFFAIKLTGKDRKDKYVDFEKKPDERTIFSYIAISGKQSLISILISPEVKTLSMIGLTNFKEKPILRTRAGDAALPENAQHFSPVPCYDVTPKSRGPWDSLEIFNDEIKSLKSGALSVCRGLDKVNPVWSR